MRGNDEQQSTVFSYVNAEQRIAAEHPLRRIRALTEVALRELSGDGHFTVDGTLIEAWASRRSFEKKADPPERGTGARGRKLLRDTHESKTDREARLFRRSQAAESRPSYLGHVLTENRNGLVMAACVTQSRSRAEREAALAMVDELPVRAEIITLGADKGYQEETSSRVCGSGKWCRMWPNTRCNRSSGPTGCVRPRGTILGLSRARKSASRWNKFSAGSSMGPACGRRSFADGGGWTGCFVWQQQP